MTVQDLDRDAIRHGKITEKPLRAKEPNPPTWVIKLWMAITGIIFGLFVVVHMIGNLKVFMPPHMVEGKLTYHIDEYGEFLRTVGEPIFPREGILWIFRITLLVCLVLHVWGGFAIHGRGSKSRGRYKRRALMKGLGHKGYNSKVARTMIISGTILLCFIIFHILDLTLGVQPAASGEFHHGTIQANLYYGFSRPAVAIWYIIAMLLLFTHLSHGLWTAVSDLGFTGHKTRSVLLFISYLLPALVMVGNISIPLVVMLGWNPIG